MRERQSMRLDPHYVGRKTSVPEPFEHFAFHGNAVNPDTGAIAKYVELSKCSEGHHWRQSNTDEIGRLAQGYGDIKGTNTMFFIPFSEIPENKISTYLRVVSAYRPEKENPRRVRWTVGGDRIDYPGDVSTKTADLTTSKILVNSTLSTPKALFGTGDIKDYYLGTPLPGPEFMRIPLHMIPPEIMIAYDLEKLVHKGAVYVRIDKGMYGLPQAGKLANDQLQKFLAVDGYEPMPVTPGLWRHKTRDIQFCLVVDDFGIKYTDKADADHLFAALRKHYVVSEDWTGNRYCGLTLDWDYKARTCKISMPGYVARALARFTHATPPTPEDSPHAWEKPVYGKHPQYAPPPDSSAALNAKDVKHVQTVLGTFLYYARAVDSTMLAAIGTIAMSQADPTVSTLAAITHLLNYCATHPEATLLYRASDMVLHVESDASYLSCPKARSRAAGYHFLSDRPRDPTKAPDPSDPPPTANGAIDVLCQVMREVLSSAAEAELAALYHNGKQACPLRTTLEELGHPQPPTPIQTDNSTAAGIANDTVKQKRSKAIDMRFYWIRDRVRQGQFIVYWKKGSLNKADYFTKHHPASHHRDIRSVYLHSPTDPAKNYFDCLQDAEPDIPSASTATT
jgi:hypothetical protein